MRRFGSLLLALGALALAPTAASAQDAPARCTVAYVVDGDTFNCKDGTTIRLLMVDAPEGGRFGDVSRRALATLMPAGTNVRVETDVETWDGQGRLRAYVHLDDGRMVNEVMIRKGFAFFKPSLPNEGHAERLRTAEAVARRDALGVWAR